MLVGNLHDRSAGAQCRVIGNFLHGQYGRAGDFVFPEMVDCFELGLVGNQLFDLGKNFENVGLPRACRVIGWIVDPLRLTQSLAGSPPVRSWMVK